MKRGAVISPDGQYRYALTRQWAFGPAVTFIMLNPSTADDERDDPTVRRCMSFARSWGCGGLAVVNVFAFRTPYRERLKRCPAPFGPENVDWQRFACTSKDPMVICAWGVDVGRICPGADVDLLNRLAEWEVMPRALRVTRDGHPAHPLYLPADLTPEPLWRLREAQMLAAS